MNDRELLELAAKAIGEEGYWADYPGMGTRTGYQGAMKLDGYYWNPLTHDGDAFRLAVALGISVWHRTTISKVYACGPVTDKCFALEVERLPDPDAATRMAIVMVAAQIGRQME